MSLEGGKSIEEVKEELNFFYELSSAVGFPVRRNSTFESFFVTLRPNTQLLINIL